MKAPDYKSTLVAGLLGAALVWLLVKLGSSAQARPWFYPAVGFAAGAGIQIAVRVLGVS
jgi:hypothetical protein